MVAAPAKTAPGASGKRHRRKRLQDHAGLLYSFSKQVGRDISAAESRL